MSTPSNVGALHDNVLSALGAAVVSGRYAPGEVITLEGVSAEHGVSRSVVREAIRVLRQFGVNRLPVLQKGRMVGILTRQDAIIALAGEVRRSANLPARLIPAAHPGRPRLVTTEGQR